MLPECVFLEMTLLQSLSDPPHDEVVRQLQQLDYHVSVVDRLPSCYCGDYTHRDRWFAIAFHNPGPSYDIFQYCTNNPRPVSDVLDSIESILMNHAPFGQNDTTLTLGGVSIMMTLGLPVSILADPLYLDT